MRSSRRSLFRWLLLLSLHSCDGRAGVSASRATFRVGVILPLSGDQSALGEETWAGMELALHALEQQGLRWELIRKDDASNKQLAGNHAKHLIEVEGVNVLIGSVASGNTEQVALEARESGVPLLNSTSTNDGLTQRGGPFVSRICFKDSFQGAALATFAHRQGWKRAVVVVDRAQLYSTGLAENFERAFTATGGTARSVSYTTEDTDFSGVILNVEREVPDVIFFAGYYGQGGPLIRQAGERWRTVPILGGDGLDSPELLELVGSTSATIYLSTHFAADDPDERARAFVASYREAYGKLPGSQAALGYDVLLVLADACRRCPDPRDRAALAKAIRATCVEGVTGTICLTTEDRTPIKDVIIVKVEGGELRYHDRIEAR